MSSVANASSVHTTQPDDHFEIFTPRKHCERRGENLVTITDVCRGGLSGDSQSPMFSAGECIPKKMQEDHWRNRPGTRAIPHHITTKTTPNRAFLCKQPVKEIGQLQNNLKAAQSEFRVLRTHTHK